MITVDGSYGEGGGQILRTSLALSLVTGQAFRIDRIRAGRKNPGLLRQHLTAVQAATEIGQAEVIGAAIGSTELTFRPGKTVPGDYKFAIGTAGSTTLVLQTVLPALLLASGPSTLRLEGGTHNSMSPSFDFLARAFLPLVNRMGPQVKAELFRPGFYPAGGGEMQITVEPATRLAHLDLVERGEVVRRGARAIIANLARRIGEREMAIVGRKLSWSDEWLEVQMVENSRGPGNIVLIELEAEHVTEVFTGFGERGMPAEAVADKAVQALKRYLATEAAVGEHLADQLLVPMALAGGGSFTTIPLSRHATTNIEIIKQFLPVKIEVAPLESRCWRVEIGAQ